MRSYEVEMERDLGDRRRRGRYPGAATLYEDLSPLNNIMSLMCESASPVRRSARDVEIRKRVIEPVLAESSTRGRGTKYPYSYTSAPASRDAYRSSKPTFDLYERRGKYSYNKPSHTKENDEPNIKKLPRWITRKCEVPMIMDSPRRMEIQNDHMDLIPMNTTASSRSRRYDDQCMDLEPVHLTQTRSMRDREPIDLVPVKTTVSIHGRRSSRRAISPLHITKNDFPMILDRESSEINYKSKKQLAIKSKPCSPSDDLYRYIANRDLVVKPRYSTDVYKPSLQFATKPIYSPSYSNAIRRKSEEEEEEEAFKTRYTPVYSTPAKLYAMSRDLVVRPRYTPIYSPPADDLYSMGYETAIKPRYTPIYNTTTDLYPLSHREVAVRPSTYRYPFDLYSGYQPSLSSRYDYSTDLVPISYDVRSRYSPYAVNDLVPVSRPLVSRARYSPYYGSVTRRYDLPIDYKSYKSLEPLDLYPLSNWKPARRKYYDLDVSNSLSYRREPQQVKHCKYVTVDLPVMTIMPRRAHLVDTIVPRRHHRHNDMDLDLVSSSSRSNRFKPMFVDPYTPKDRPIQHSPISHSHSSHYHHSHGIERPMHAWKPVSSSEYSRPVYVDALPVSGHVEGCDQVTYEVSDRGNLMPVVDISKCKMKHH